MDLRLKDNVIIISGGAKGIGSAISLVLAEEGATVAIIGRNETDNTAHVKKIVDCGGQAFAVCAELSEPDECRRAVDEIVARFERIDGLVNNAGVNDGINLEHGGYAQFINSLHKNLVHYYLLAHHCLPFLKISKGPIVNISSKTAETGQGGTSAYAAANGGRNALTREWAVELSKYGIRVNAVVVAECLTPNYEKWLKSYPDPTAKMKEITDLIPFEKRMTSSREIADMVSFLLSDRSSHTTGQLIHVDGGYVHLDRAIGKFSE
ncbi:SDR family oxidoreductase [Niabella insulamsoli]|uniref:SDR family oxidoreductase n=1 Tax=Niabella insulamsoli TaxID=3144874 RepID=UPI0031FD0676